MKNERIRRFNGKLAMSLKSVVARGLYFKLGRNQANTSSSEVAPHFVDQSGAVLSDQR